MLHRRTRSNEIANVSLNSMHDDRSAVRGPIGRQFVKAVVFGAGILTVSTIVSSAQAAKHSCTIEKVSDGNIVPNIANRKLTSKRFGGYSGRLKITTTRGRYKLRVNDPLGFTNSPANGADAVQFKTSFMGNGATNFAERPGYQRIKLKEGVTFVETHFVAKKLNRKTFPAGNYTATLTLTCK